VKEILYYLDLNGQTAGPFTLDQVRIFHQAGTISDATIYSTPESQGWMPVSILKPLFTRPVVLPEIIPAPAAVAPEVMWTFRVKRSDSFGSGCLIQFLGLVCLVIGLVTVASLIGPLICWSLGFLLLIRGQRNARWYECGNCGGRLASNRGHKCPYCHSWFKK
jgi:GYF domain 2